MLLPAFVGEPIKSDLAELLTDTPLLLFGHVLGLAAQGRRHPDRYSFVVARHDDNILNRTDYRSVCQTLEKSATHWSGANVVRNSITAGVS